MKHFYYSILLLLSFSCNTSKKEVSVNEAEIFQRASDFYTKEDYEKSLKYFDTLIIINSVNGEYYFKRGVSKMWLLDDKGAIKDFFNAIKYNYDKKRAAYLNIGTLYRSYLQYDSAIYFYDKAIEVDPTYEKAKTEKEEVLTILRDKKLLFNN